MKFTPPEVSRIDLSSDGKRVEVRVHLAQSLVSVEIAPSSPDRTLEQSIRAHLDRQDAP
jgi:hypothetical protein